MFFFLNQESILRLIFYTQKMLYVFHLFFFHKLTKKDDAPHGLISFTFSN